MQTYTITPERAEQLKAEAIAARAPWQNVHYDRLARERDARKTAKEYRKAQLDAAKAEGLKRCTVCGEMLPLDSYSPAHRDRPTARCKPCVATATRARYHVDLEKARKRTRNRKRPSPDPEKQRQRERMAEERRDKASERKRKRAERDRKRQAVIAERIAHLSALLDGTANGERINSEQGWNMADAELQRLWPQSGDKTCVDCHATVPPERMFPPGPANFYPGKCKPCAHIAWETAHRRTIGVPIGPLPGPRLIPMRDGTAITIGEFARRVRDREVAGRSG